MGKYFPPTAAEIHSFGIGAMDGVSWKPTDYRQDIDAAAKRFDDIRKEKHYYRTGYFLTNRGKWVGATTLGLSQGMPLIAQVIQVCL